MPSKDKVTVGMKVTYAEAERFKEQARNEGMSLDKYLRYRIDSAKNERLIELGKIYEIEPDVLMDFIEDLLRDGKILVIDGKAELV